MLREGGVEAEEVITENRSYPIRSAGDWWTIVLGSGRREAIEQLTPTEVAVVKTAALLCSRPQNHESGDDRSSRHRDQKSN